MLTVSVVIPTYKASAFIRETLASVFAQTRLPDEVIVADDCSPDDTAVVVEEIAKSAPVPVRVIRLEKNSGGPARPLNVGIAAARGDLIATLDHDDRLAPVAVEHHRACHQQYPHVGLSFGLAAPHTSEVAERRRLATLEAVRRIRTGSTGVFSLIPSDHAYSALVSQLCYAHSCSSMSFRKNVWRACGGFDEQITTTGDFRFLQQVAANYDIGFIDDVVFTWTLRPESLYLSAGGRKTDWDTLRVYRSFDLERLPHSSRAELMERIVETEFSLAYTERNAGFYGTAFRLYVQNLSSRTSWRSALVGLAKLLPHRLLRRKSSGIGQERGGQ